MANEPMQDALKPCPMDGGTVKHWTDSAMHYGDKGYKQKSEEFSCDCGFKFCVRGDGFTKEQAFMIYNTRAQPTPEADLESDVVNEDPLLLEVLNFIEMCRTLKITTGYGDTADAKVERVSIRDDADALYKKLDAVKWGTRLLTLGKGEPKDV